jgi:hypothetical protein
MPKDPKKRKKPQERKDDRVKPKRKVSKTVSREEAQTGGIAA